MLNARLVIIFGACSSIMVGVLRRFVLQRLFIGALALSIAVWAGAAPVHAKNCRPAKFKLNVKFLDPKVKIVHSKTVTELNRMLGNRDKKVGGGLNSWHKKSSVIRGATVAPLNRASSFKPYYVKRGGRYCYSIKELNINFGFKEHTVFIPRIYAPKSCEYKVVYAHEMTHVKINRKAIKKFLPKFKKQLAKDLSKTAAAVVKSQKAGVAAMRKVIAAALIKGHANMYQYSTPLHNKIDTPKNYRREDAKCKKWVRDVR